MDKIKKSSLFRVISLVLILTFISLDISYAYLPEHNAANSTLATPSALQQTPVTEQAARFQQSVFSQSALIASVYDIGEYFFGNAAKGIESLPSKYAQDVIRADLLTHLSDAGTEILNIVPVEYIKKTAPEKLKSALVEIGFKGTLPDEGVVFILYKKGDKKFLVQVARKDQVSSDSLPGYEWVVSDRYVVKYMPEDYVAPYGEILSQLNDKTPNVTVAQIKKELPSEEIGGRIAIRIIHLNESDLSAFRMKILDVVKNKEAMPLDELVGMLPQNSALRNALTSLTQIQGEPTDEYIQRIIKENNLNNAEQVAFVLVVQPGQGEGDRGGLSEFIRNELDRQWHNTHYTTAHFCEFEDFNTQIMPGLLSIVNNEEEANVALDLIFARIKVEVSDVGGWATHGDHHAYPEYALEKFEVKEAIALVSDAAQLRALIEQKIKQKGSDISSQADEAKYQKLLLMSKDYGVIESQSGPVSHGYEEDSFELSQRGFDNVFKAIDLIVEQIKEKIDNPDTGNFIAKLVSILEDLTHLKVSVGTVTTAYDHHWTPMHEYAKWYDCAGPVRDKAQEVLRKVRVLLRKDTSTEKSVSLPVDNHIRVSGKLEEIGKNSGLPVSKHISDVPAGVSNNILWSETLHKLHFDKDVYRRVESVDIKNEKGDITKKGEITTGDLDDENNRGSLINKLGRQYDVRTGDFKSIRLGSGVKDFLEDKKAQVTPEAYFMHRGVYTSKEDILKAFYGNNKLRFDITIIPPAFWGEEYAKTIGHYHFSVDYPEIYQVVSGEVLWLMQKCNIGEAKTEKEVKEALDKGEIEDFIAVRAKAGDIVIMLPGYGHVSVNLSETEPLIMADWLTWHQKSYYGSFEEKSGAAYYVIKNDKGQPELKLNPKYAPPKRTRQMTAKDQISEFGLKRGEPIYNLVKLADSNFIEKTRFLYHPNDYGEFLTPEETLDKVKPEEQIKVASSSLGEYETKYQELLSMSKHYRVTSAEEPDHRGLSKMTIEQLDQNGFEDVFRAINGIVEEIKTVVGKLPSSQDYINKLISILEELTNLKVIVGTHGYYSDHHSNYPDLPYDSRSDCAEPVRTRAKDALDQIRQLIEKQGSGGSTSSSITTTHLDDNSLSAFRMKIYDAAKKNQAVSLNDLINFLPQNSVLRNTLLSLKQVQGTLSDADIKRIIKENNLNDADQVAFVLAVKPGQGMGDNAKVKDRNNPRVSQLFELVESSLNSERARFIETGNRLISSVPSKPDLEVISTIGVIDKTMATAKIKQRVERAIAAIESLDKEGVIPETKTAIELLKKNLNQFEADGAVGSLIVLARKAKKENQKLIIGLETDWIPGINVENSLQRQAITALMKEIDSIAEALESMGLDNVEVIRGSGSQLADAIMTAKETSKTLTSMHNIVVMASANTINSDDFAALRNADESDRPFLAGIDPTELIKLYTEFGESVSKQLYIRLASLLYMTLELAAGKEPPQSPIIVSYDKKLRILILLPKADPIDYEMLKNNYAAEKTALAAA